MSISESGSSVLPYTGKEFLNSLDDGREVWIYGERVKNIAEHAAFRNTARMIARLYDALHQDHKDEKGILTCPTEWGGFTHRYFQAPRSAEELVAARDAIAAWARLTYGWLGRSPDYKAALAWRKLRRVRAHARARKAGYTCTCEWAANLYGLDWFGRRRKGSAGYLDA